MVLAKASPIDIPDLDTSVVDLGLSTRAVNALLSAGLDTLGKISNKNYEELLKIPKIGQGTATEITRKIAHLSLKGSKRRIKDPITTDRELDLSVLALDRRAFRSLTNAGISTVGELFSLDKKTLLSIKGIGEKTYKHIQKALKTYQQQREQGDIAITNLGLDNRTLNALRRNNLFYVSQIENMSKEELSSLRGMGSTSLENLLSRYKLVTGKTISSSKDMYQLDGICEDKTPLERLDLPSRAYNALKKNGFRYVEEVAELKESDFLNIKNIGVKSLEDVKYELNRFFNAQSSETLKLKTLDEYICLLQNVLSDRQKDVLNRRLALWSPCPETLENIAQDYGISRERIRQIEKKARKKLFAASNIKIAEPLFVVVRRILDDLGGISDISNISSELLKLYKAEKINVSSVIPLLLSLVGCKELSEGLWGLSEIEKDQIDEINHQAETIINNHGPLPLDDLVKMVKESVKSAAETLIQSVIVSSKKLVVTTEQTVQLSEKLLISKSRVDYAKVVLKKLKRPAHYREITELINEMLPGKSHYSPKSIQVALGSSKDLVRVRVGTYALKEEFIN